MNLSSSYNTTKKPDKSKATENPASSSTTSTTTPVLDPDALSAALDYLCLHLTDKELQNSFKENKKQVSECVLDICQYPRPVKRTIHAHKCTIEHLYRC